MMKRVMILCLALLILLPAVRIEGSKPASRAQEEEEEGGVAPLLLPRARNSWLIEMSRDGGMRPSNHSVSISSTGEISVKSTHYASGKQVVDCSLKEKLSVGDLSRLNEAIRAARLSRWRERYSDPKHPQCCDQPTTHLTLQRRDAAGRTPQSISTSWYPGSAELRPADLVTVAELAQRLWNKTSEHCNQ